MSDGEKRNLIDRLESSLKQANGPGDVSAPAPLTDTVAGQKRAWDRLFEHIANMPRPEPDERIASRDHDAILYGESPHDRIREKQRRDLH